MPYIDQEERDKFWTQHESVASPQTPGELNYVITAYLVSYLEGKGLSYQVINDIIGALEGAKMEFYRRVAAPYEDKKIKENGDVYV